MQILPIIIIIIIIIAKTKIIASLIDARVIKGLIEEADYEDQGILQVDHIRYTKMNEKVNTKYLRGSLKVLDTKVNGGNIIKGVNQYLFWGTLKHLLIGIVQNRHCYIEKLESW